MLPDFRQTYLDHAQLTTQLQLWQAQAPDIVHLQSIGLSAEGRELWLLTIGKNPGVPRPAVWVDGNMHAGELCGSSVALAIAADLIALHRGEASTLPSPVADAVKEAHVYILPRMSPDGAEAVLKSGRYLRSSSEDRRPQQSHAHWRTEDMDGDGTVAEMRQRCDSGELVALPGYPQVLVPREIGDVGPFYKVYPEGRIANFDGFQIPHPYFLADNQTDFNRNFPFSWAPEPEQAGAGDFPGSACETRAVLEFVSTHANIFAWLNLHTFGGVCIRPLGDKPDSKMDPDDRAMFNQLEAWMTEFTTYPTVSGYHEFTYEPEKPLRGDLTEYAYNQRGAMAYVVELWDLFKQIGISRITPFVDHYVRLGRQELTTLANWDQTHNQGRIFQPWRPFQHPQLGAVELGGPQPLIGIWNPPEDELPGICAGQSAAFLRVASLLPRLSLACTAKDVIGPGLTRLTCKVANLGYWGTYGLQSAKQLPHVEPLRLTAEGSGLKVLAPATKTLDLGHLDGWGNGLFNTSLFTPWTRGNSHAQTVTFVVEGSGQLKVTAGSCRVGHVELSISI